MADGSDLGARQRNHGEPRDASEAERDAAGAQGAAAVQGASAVEDARPVRDARSANSARDAETRLLFGWILLVCAAPVAFLAFYNEPGMHLFASLALGTGAATLMGVGALVMMWPVTSRRQRGCAIGCSLFAIGIPFLTLIGVLVLFAMAGS